jgi:hypothetical protein
MSAAAVKNILGILSSFQPRTFESDDHASNYLRGISQSRRPKYGANAIDKLVRNFAEINGKLRKGDSSGPDIKAIDAEMEPLPDNLILSRVVGPEAFGLTPENISQLEEYTGKLVADRGYSSTNIGTPLPHQAGQITMVIATPKGTRAALSGSGNKPSREVFLDREQPLRITKVDSDGQGGFYVLAVATEKGSKGNIRSKKLGPAAKAPAVSPAEEAGVPQAAPVPGPPAPVPQAPNPEAPQAPAPGALVVPKKQGRPAGPPPAPRSDGHVAENLGGQGQSRAEASAPSAPRGAETPSPTTETPEPAPHTPGPEVAPQEPFRDAFRKANINGPSSTSPRRKDFNTAFLGASSGKREPTSIVGELEDRISLYESQLKADKEDGTDSGTLPKDIGQLQQLAQFIRKHFGLGGVKEEKKEPAKKAPAKKVAAPAKKVVAPKAAPSTPEAADQAIKEAERPRRPHRAKVAKKASEPVSLAEPTKDGRSLGDRWLEAADMKRDDLSEVEQVGLNLLADQVASGALSRPEAAKRLGGGSSTKLTKVADGLAKVPRNAGPKKVAKRLTEQPVPDRKKPGLAAGKTNANQVTNGDRILVRKNAAGDWEASSTKTGATTLTVTGKASTKGRRSGIQITGTDEDGNQITVKPGPSHQTFWKAEIKTAPPKKAPDAPQKAPDAPQKAPDAGPKMSTKPLLPNNWDRGGGGGEIDFHGDGDIGVALDALGDDKKLDVDGDALANVWGRLATRAVSGDITERQLIDETKKLRDKFPADSKPYKIINRAAESMDAPEMTAPSLPSQAPAPLKKLAQDLVKIPLARKDRPGDGPSELTMLQELIRDWMAGELSPLRFKTRLVALSNNRHESREGKFEVDRVIKEAIDAIGKMDRKDLLPPTPPLPSRITADDIDKARSVETISQGNVGDNRKIVLANGKEVFVKHSKKWGLRSGAEITDAEEMANALAQAIGAPVPDFVRANRDTIYTDWINGTVGSEIIDAINNPLPGKKELWGKILNSKESKVLGLFDALSLNPDRHHGNWMIDEKGKLKAIDHGQTWHKTALTPQERLSLNDSPFLNKWIYEYGEFKDNPFTLDDIQKLQDRITAIRNRFEDLDRVDWYNRTLVVLKLLKSHATGTEDLIT